MICKGFSSNLFWCILLNLITPLNLKDLNSFGEYSQVICNFYNIKSNLHKFDTLFYETSDKSVLKARF